VITWSLLRLIESHSLRKLSLSWNGIQDDGAFLLAKQISESNSRLRDLDISCNFIGARGISALREMTDFRRSKGLSLDLNYRNNSYRSSPYSSYLSRPPSSIITKPVLKFLNLGKSTSINTTPIPIPKTSQTTTTSTSKRTLSIFDDFAL